MKRLLVFSLILMLIPLWVFAEDELTLGGADGSMSCEENGDNYKCDVTVNKGSSEDETNIVGIMGNIENGVINKVEASGAVDTIPASESNDGVDNFKITYNDNNLESISFSLYITSTEEQVILNNITLSYTGSKSFKMNDISATLPKPAENDEISANTTNGDNSSSDSTDESSNETTESSIKKVKNPKTTNRNVAYLGIFIVISGAVGLVILNKKKLMI